MKLTLYKAQIESTASYPGESSQTLVAVVKFPLNKKLAYKLKCGDTFYDQNNQIRTTIVGKAGLKIQFEGGTVGIGQRSSISVDKIWKFRIWTEETETGVEIWGVCRMHFSTDRAEVWGMADELNLGETTIAIDSDQAELEFMDDESAEEEEPAAKVETARGPSLADVRDVQSRSRRGVQ